MKKMANHLPHADGFVRLIVPGDVLAGRYVSNVASIVVRDPGVLPTIRQRQPSSALYVVGAVNNPAKDDLANVASTSRQQRLRCKAVPIVAFLAL